MLFYRTRSDRYKVYLLCYLFFVYRPKFGSSNRVLSTMTPISSFSSISRWMNSLDSSLDSPTNDQYSHKISVLNKEQWDILNMLGEQNSFNTNKCKLLLDERNKRNQTHQAR
jgi:hypothetical protein